MSQQEALHSRLSSHPVIFVTRTIERALGLPLGTPGYYIVTNKFPGEQNFIDQAKGRLKTIHAPTSLDTHELLEHPDVVTFIKNIPRASILVFKNTALIERAVKKLTIPLLNPPSKIGSVVEEKISQLAWLGELSSFLPPHHKEISKNIEFAGEPFILQFNHAHSGEGTELIQTAADLARLQEKFPNREARITSYIRGPVFTSNNVVTDKDVLMGNISYQITGLPPFTDLPFATIGNDWGLAKRYLSKEHRVRMQEFVDAIGTKLREGGFRGLFGIDVVLESKTNKLYLLEINARQPASAPFESVLQKQTNPSLPSIFEAHLTSLLQLPCDAIGEVRSGAQLIQRATREWLALKPSFNLEKFKAAGFTVFPSENAEPNAEVLRIQSAEGVLESHNKFNDTGRQIISLLPFQTLKEERLTKPAEDLCMQYLHLPVGQGVKTPYFNNRKRKVRGSLRSLAGKGYPTEIVDEIRIHARRAHIDLTDLDERELSKFLVDHFFGIDCSGLAFHILNAESEGRGSGTIQSHLKYEAKSFLRKIITKMRPAENTNVAVLADSANSIEVPLHDVKPGDFIVMLQSSGTPEEERDHLVLIKKVESNDQGPKRLTYIHSIAWPNDGMYGHGVREGTIEIRNDQGDLVSQHWLEAGKTGAENYTFKRLQYASVASLRRLKWL